MDHSFDFVVRVRGFIIKVCWTSFAPGIKSNRREGLTMVRLLSACMKLGLYGPTMVCLYGVWPVWAYNGAPVWGWAGGSGRKGGGSRPRFPCALPAPTRASGLSERESGSRVHWPHACQPDPSTHCLIQPHCHNPANIICWWPLIQIICKSCREICS